MGAHRFQCVPSLENIQALLLVVVLCFLASKNNVKAFTTRRCDVGPKLNVRLVKVGVSFRALGSSWR